MSLILICELEGVVQKMNMYVLFSSVKSEPLLLYESFWMFIKELTDKLEARLLRTSVPGVMWVNAFLKQCRVEQQCQVEETHCDDVELLLTQ